MTYTWIDYIIFAIFIISILIGLRRGFLREAIALIALIAAFVISIKFCGVFASWMSSSAFFESIIKSLSTMVGEDSATDALSMVALGFSFFILFIVTLLVGEIVNRIVAGATAGLSLIDHVLGTVFGAIRGYLMTVVFLFLVSLTTLQQDKAWTESRLRPNFDTSIAWLANVVKPGLEIIKDKVNKAFENVSGGVINNE